MGLFGNLKNWWLANDDTYEEIKGQFMPEEVSRSISAQWGEAYSPGSQNPITQFLRGAAETITFKGRLFAYDITDDINKDMELLASWAKVNPELGRPPILAFWVGDAHIRLRQCVITELNPSYGEPRSDGSAKDITFTITLKEFVPWSLETVAPGESRYHHVRLGDYYEMVAYREYGDPLLGDVIRKRHPQLANIVTGDVVVLPSAGAIRIEIVEPKSIQLEGAFKPKDTPQRRLRIEMFDLRNTSFVSHVVLE